MATNHILVSYLISKGAGRSSGMRVWSDGRAEIKSGAEEWKKVTQLEPDQVGKLAQALNASGILKLPAHLAAPEGVFDTPFCEWQANIEGKKTRVVVEGWSEQRSRELNVSNLMDQMYHVISAAQMSASKT